MTSPISHHNFCLTIRSSSAQKKKQNLRINSFDRDPEVEGRSVAKARESLEWNEGASRGRAFDAVAKKERRRLNGWFIAPQRSSLAATAAAIQCRVIKP